MYNSLTIETMKWKIFIICFFSIITHLNAQNNWDGDSGVGNFTHCNNWYADNCPLVWNSSTDLIFNFRNNGAQTSMYYDFGTWSDVRSIIYQNTFPVSFDLNSDNVNGLNFYWKIENYSTFSQTLYIPLSGKGTVIELNPIYGDLKFYLPIYNDNNVDYKIYGDSYKKIIINPTSRLVGDTNADLDIEGYSIVELNFNHIDGYKGLTNINNGELWLDSNAVLNSSSIRVGNGNSNTCKIYISNASIATTVSNPIVVPTNSSSSTIGALNTSNTHTFSSTINLNNNNVYFDEVSSGGTVDFTGAISGTGGITKTSTGTVKLSNTNNSYSGNTIINSGTLILGTSEVISNSSNLVLNGGILSTGSGIGYSETLGSLQLLNNATIALGSGSHNLTFTNSNAVLWTAGKTLTITGWDGSCKGRIFISSNNSSLTTSQLAQITFSGYGSGAALLTTGELMPVGLVGTTSANQSICKSNTISDITISGYTGSITKWQYASNVAFTSGVTDIASTLATLSSSIIGNLNSTRYFRADILTGLGSCASTYSSVITISISSTTYSGTWNNGTPDATKCAIFTSNFTSTGSISACSCQITGTASVTIDSGHSLTTVGEIIVDPTASLIFNNSASLVQTDLASTNSGNITYKRATSTIANNYDYVYWGTPVQGQTLSSMWMVNNGGVFYTFDATINDWSLVAGSTTMTPGIGYIAQSESGNGGWTMGSPYTSTFFGTPNNGSITTTIYKSGSTNVNNLISNPYPCALDLELFYTDNAGVISPNFYFWTHNTAISNGTTGSYTSSDYATYNAPLQAGVGTHPASSGGNTPDRYVDAAQGFFVEGIGSGGTATFKNSQRVSGNNNAFYRSSNVVSEPIEKELLWLNLSNNQGLFKQQLVGYAQGATNDLDALFDAKSFEGNPFADFYSVVGTDKCIIQSRSLPFLTTDVVALGYSVTFSGEVHIALDHFDTFFDNQNIYLEDTDTNTLTNLKTNSYTFTTQSGTFNNRFKLRYLTNEELHASTFGNYNTISVFHETKGIRLISSISGIAKLTVFDTLGRKCIEQSYTDQKEVLLTQLPLLNTIWLAEVELQNGQKSTLKLVR